MILEQGREKPSHFVQTGIVQPRICRKASRKCIKSPLRATSYSSHVRRRVRGSRRTRLSPISQRPGIGFSRRKSFLPRGLFVGLTIPSVPVPHQCRQAYSWDREPQPELFGTCTCCWTNSCAIGANMTTSSPLTNYGTFFDAVSTPWKENCPRLRPGTPR